MLGESIPERLIQLAKIEHLSDAFVVRVNQLDAEGTMVLVLRGGGSQGGYFDLRLTYENAMLSPQDDFNLARIARSFIDYSRHPCELAYHEVDVDAESYVVHRFLFHALQTVFPHHGGRIEFQIKCKSLHWRKIPRRSRRIIGSVDRYPGGPPT